MPSRLEYAKNHFNKGLSMLQKLSENKKSIEKGLKEFNLSLKGDDTILSFLLEKFYEFLEDDFGPRIRLIEKQINEGKLSKRNYNNLIEDTYNGEDIDIFKIQFSPIYKTFKSKMGIAIKNDKDWSEFMYLNEWVNHLTYSIEPIESIIKYGLEKEDSEYYYFEWYKVIQIKENIDKLALNLESGYGKDIELEDNKIKDEYYNNLKKNDIKGKDTNKERVLLYKNRIIFGPNGERKRITGKQNRLCKFLFEKNKIINHMGIDVEEYVYDEAQDKPSTLKSLVNAVNKKFKSIGYKENILSYVEERVLINEY